MSVVWASEPPLVIRRLIAFWLLVVGAVGIVRWTPARAIPWFLGLSAAFYIVVGLGVEMRLGTFVPSGRYRFCGTLHPNAQGINCAMLTLSGLWIAASGGRRNRFVGTALGLMGLIFLLMTRSRTSFAATMGACLVLFVLRLHPRRRWVVAAALVNAGILMVMLYVNGMLDPLLELFLLGRGDKDVGTLNSRMPLWQILTPYLAQRPITGFGFAGFMTVQHAMEIALLLEFGIAAAHSVYLDVALGTGLVGLTLFVVTLVAAFGQGALQSFGPRLGTGVSLLAAIVAFELVNGVLDSSLVFPAWRFPALVVITSLCLMRPMRRNLAEEGGDFERTENEAWS
jgi:O-antigen ligase